MSENILLVTISPLQTHSFISNRKIFIIHPPIVFISTLLIHAHRPTAINLRHVKQMNSIAFSPSQSRESERANIDRDTGGMDGEWQTIVTACKQKWENGAHKKINWFPLFWFFSSCLSDFIVLEFFFRRVSGAICVIRENRDPRDKSRKLAWNESQLCQVLIGFALLLTREIESGELKNYLSDIKVIIRR